MAQGHDLGACLADGREAKCIPKGTDERQAEDAWRRAITGGGPTARSSPLASKITARSVIGSTRGEQARATAWSDDARVASPPERERQQ